ncbi:MAG: pyruvate kinase alpha/beta domain-containing protein, partial [Gammaproteobacteria bacterium]
VHSGPVPASMVIAGQARSHDPWHSSVVNDRLRQVDEICSTALEIAQAQGMASRGDTLLITAGVPFGKPGTTNTLRIETLI